MERIHVRTVQKKILMNQITMMVWSATQSQTFWSVKSNRLQEALLLVRLVDVMEFQYSYSKPQTMMPSRCCIQNVGKSGRPSSGHRTGKGQLSPQFPRRIVLKNVLTIRQLYSSPMLVRSCLKSQHARLQHYVSQERTVVQTGFRKVRGTGDQIANICWIIEKAREFQKNI